MMIKVHISYLHRAENTTGQVLVLVNGIPGSCESFAYPGERALEDFDVSDSYGNFVKGLVVVLVPQLSFLTLELIIWPGQPKEVWIVLDKEPSSIWTNDIRSVNLSSDTKPQVTLRGVKETS